MDNQSRKQSKGNRTPKEKKSFIIHKDSLDILDELNDTQTANLFRAIRQFQTGKEVELDAITKIAFMPFKNQFIRDNIAYKELCEKNKEIAENRKNNSPTVTERNEALPLSPTVTYKDSDKDKDKDKDNDKDSESDNTHSHFLNFNYYQTKYDILPTPLKESIQNKDWENWQNLNTLIDNKHKNIRKISKQLTYTEYLQLKQDYITSNSIKKDRFAKLLSDFNNNKGIENKYEAVFPALCKWIEIEKRK